MLVSFLQHDDDDDDPDDIPMEDLPIGKSSIGILGVCHHHHHHHHHHENDDVEGYNDNDDDDDAEDKYALYNVVEKCVNRGNKFCDNSAFTIIQIYLSFQQNVVKIKVDYTRSVYLHYMAMTEQLKLYLKV